MTAPAERGRPAGRSCRRRAARRDGELKSYMDLFFLALIVLLSSPTSCGSSSFRSARSSRCGRRGSCGAPCPWPERRASALRVQHARFAAPASRPPCPCRHAAPRLPSRAGLRPVATRSSTAAPRPSPRGSRRDRARARAGWRRHRPAPWSCAATPVAGARSGVEIGEAGCRQHRGLREHEVRHGRPARDRRCFRRRMQQTIPRSWSGSPAGPRLPAPALHDAIAARLQVADDLGSAATVRGWMSCSSRMPLPLASSRWIAGW